MVEEWILANLGLYYTLVGMGISFILFVIAKILYILRTTSSKIPLKDLINTTSSGNELKEINSIITGRINPKLINGIEVIDLDDEETDAKGNSE